jgi:hypothetical protein
MFALPVPLPLFPLRGIIPFVVPGAMLLSVPGIVPGGAVGGDVCGAVEVGGGVPAGLPAAPPAPTQTWPAPIPKDKAAAIKINLLLDIMYVFICLVN